MEPQFGHERLDVYVTELEFIRWVALLLKEVKQNDAESTEVRDHLDRASLSALLNTAEGNGKRMSRSRSKFFDDARGSATECAACLDALVVKNATSQDRIVEGKALLVRIVQMLSRLISLTEKDPRVREEGGDYEDQE
jgi:four helix bundle protein